MISNDEGEGEKKKKKGTWDPDNMPTAIEKVLSKEMSARQAADRYEVPRTTLNDRISAIKNEKEVPETHPTSQRSDPIAPTSTDSESQVAFSQQKDVHSTTSASEHQMATSESKCTSIIDQSVDNFKAIVSEMSPVPDASKRRATARRRKVEKSEILTSSLYKKILEEKKTEKNKVDSVKREDKEVSKKTKKKPNENQIHRPIQETICPLCLESHEEDWIQSGKCRVWVHEACANISELSNQYICDFCLV